MQEALGTIVIISEKGSNSLKVGVELRLVVILY